MDSKSDPNKSDSYLFIDTCMGLAPVRMSSDVLAVKEREKADRFVQQLALNNADYLIVVVSELTNLDQRLLSRLIHSRKARNIQKTADKLMEAAAGDAASVDEEAGQKQGMLMLQFTMVVSQ
jgi:hypothetical protein